MWVLVGLLAVAGASTLWRGGPRLFGSGLVEGWKTLRSMWFRLVLGFTLGGMVQLLVPGPLIAEWLGPASGLKGILIASYAGIILTGGPYVTLPVIASIYAAGAGPGPVVSLLASMGLLSLPTILTWEIPFLGVRLAVVRYIVCLAVPPLAGLAASVVFGLISPA